MQWDPSEHSTGSWKYSASDQADYNILPLVILRSLDARIDFHKQMKKITMNRDVCLTRWPMLERAVPPVCVTLEPWLFYHGTWFCFRTILGSGKTASWTSLTVPGVRHLSLLLTLSYSFYLYNMCSFHLIIFHALIIRKQGIAVPSLDISPLPPSLANTLLSSFLVCPWLSFMNRSWLCGQLRNKSEILNFRATI